MIRILEDDLKCGEFWLEFNCIDDVDFLTHNNRLIRSFFLFIKDFLDPYSLNVGFSTFDSYWMEDENLENYHLTLDKPHIKTSIDYIGTTIKEVEEINVLQIISLLDFIKQKNKDSNLIGVSYISCYSGLYYLPDKTKDTEFILYIGPGGKNFDKNRPIFNGIGIEAPLETFGDLWAPIEINFSNSYNNLKLSVNLNWDLYGKNNPKGYLMLQKALNSLIDAGWKNTMPKEIF